MNVRRSKTSLVGQAGFTLIEQLVALAIVGIIFSTTASVLPRMMNLLQGEDHKANLYLLRDQFISVLRNVPAWNETINGAANGAIFNCWTGDPSNCVAAAAPNPRIPFTPLGSDGQLMFNNQYNPRTQASHGFTLQGDFCNTFNQATPDPACPIRVELTWRALCPVSTSCFKPPIEIELTFITTLSEDLLLRFNPDRLNRTLYLAGDSKIGQHIRCQDYSQPQPPGQSLPNPELHYVVTGVNSDGSLNCTFSEDLFNKETL